MKDYEICNSFFLAEAAKVAVDLVQYTVNLTCGVRYNGIT